MTKSTNKIWRSIKILGIAIVILPGLATCYLLLFPIGQRPDNDYDVAVANPAFTDKHPVVRFDEGHYNAHTSSNLYRPLARLLENDGYDIEPTTMPMSAESLQGSDLLVIANAAGGSNPNIGGFNLPWFRKGKREDPAFQRSEVEAVRAWVQRGGSLLLIADHFPFGAAAAEMGAAFGVTLHGGFVEAARQFAGQPEPSTLLFTRENGLLSDHPITQGRSADEQVKSVMLFTGQSLDAKGLMPLLALPDSAIEFVPPPPNFEAQPAGAAQGYAFDYGEGRIVILADAGMLSAQIGPGEDKFGMNVPGVSNRQFALNLMHWLSRLM